MSFTFNVPADYDPAGLVKKLNNMVPVHTIGQATPTHYVPGPSYNPNLNNYHRGGGVPPFEKKNEVHIAQVANGFVMEVNRGEGIRSDMLVFMNKEDLGNHIRMFGLTIGTTETERIESRGF